MMCLYFIIFMFGTFLPSTYSRHVQFFRKDYVYNEQFDAFYKIHWDLYGTSWSSAFMACSDEGATLFYPKDKGEWIIAKNLTQEMAETPNITDIFIGVHDEFRLGEYITVDGHSTSSPLNVEDPGVTRANSVEAQCVLMNIETGLYRVGECFSFPEELTPFICKKVESERCPTIDQDYKYVKSSKKCYKVNKKQRMWDDAMRTCYMEGGILAVLENRQQAYGLVDTLERGLTYYIGVRKMFSQDDYYTVKGKKYEEDIQSNRYSEERARCVAVYNDNGLVTETKDCGNRLPFICEMEVNNQKY